MSGGRRICLIGLLLFIPSTLRASPPPMLGGEPGSAQGPRVLQVVGAVDDVRDLAPLPGAEGEDWLLATSGGLARVSVGGAPVPWPVAGLPGRRLRSVSVVGNAAGPDAEVWLGGVEGLARLAADDLRRTVETHSLRRVSRVIGFAGAVWAGAWGTGLHRRAATGTGARGFRRVPLGRRDGVDRVTDLLVLGETLWVATAGAGLVAVGPDGAVHRRVRRALPSPLVWSLAPGPAPGQLLAATADGLAVVAGGAVVADHPLTRAAAELAVRDLRGACVDGAGQTWVAAWGGGLRPLTSSPGSATTPPTTAAATPHRLRCRAARGAWLATGAGVVQAPAQRGRIRGRSGGMPSADVTSLARAFGRVWIGTFDRGLARMRGGTVDAVPRATTRWGVDRRVNDLGVTRGGPAGTRLWIATDRGLFWHDGRRFARDDDPAAPGIVHVTALHVDRAGALWATASRALYRWAGGRWTRWTGTEALPLVNLHAVTTDASGRVWVGSLHGLYELDPETSRFERRATATGDLPVDWVTALVPWGGGVVAGTYHGGLAVSADGRRFTVLGDRAAGGPLPAGWVNPHGMRVIGGNTLWIGTLARGLVVGAPGRGWRLLTVRDGLPSDDVTDVLPNPDGTVWVATRGGLARLTAR